VPWFSQRKWIDLNGVAYRGEIIIAMPYSDEKEETMAPLKPTSWTA
jgi:hypothetical protein